MWVLAFLLACGLNLAHDLLGVSGPTKVNLWRGSIYAVSALFGVWVLWSQGVVILDTSLVCPPLVEVYYSVAVAWYAVQLMEQDPLHKDAFVMYLHHFATLLLLGISWTYNHWGVGTLILVLHDVCDPFLEAAKGFDRVKASTWLVNACFGSFAVAFFVGRLILYPWLVLWPVVLFLQKEPSFQAFICAVLLFALLCMHLHWAKLIVRSARRSRNGQVSNEHD